MKHLITTAVCASLFAAGQLFAHAVPAQATPQLTNVCGTIITNTTWSLINSPYSVCAGGVTIAPGATLTVQPGVSVQFENSAGNKLTVSGALIAIGTLTQPITFTGVVATPGSWGGVVASNTVMTPAHVSLDYVTLEYGGVNISFGAQLSAAQAVLTITHSLIRNGIKHGVYVESNNPQATIRDTNFTGNAGNAVQLNQPKRDILHSGLHASGNGVDAVFIAGSTTMNGRRRWAFTGIPYVVDAPVSLAAGDALTIEPGSELQFTAAGNLDVIGQLNAIGLPDAPITLTGRIKSPGAWKGISVHGVADQAMAQLDYATVEYGGSALEGANIDVRTNGQLVARHSLIRYSQKDGVRSEGAFSSVSILNSRIVSNTLYGIRNSPFTPAILATNNWWGDPNGPAADTAACSTGSGDQVTNGVLFRPVLTDALTIRRFPLSDAPILALTPRRWVAPADGTTRVYFDITLRDANGAPLPGRVVKLISSLGTVADGGITDPSGKTLAYLVSSNVGEANVRASLDGLAPCEGALSPRAKVTFNPPLVVTDLFPNAPASYFASDIRVEPLPVVVGITATIYATLTNPLTVPLTVDVSFAFVQSSIGLAFGPINEIVGLVLPPSSTVKLTSGFIPPVTGHFCVQVGYNITAIGSAQVLAPLSNHQQLKQFNTNSKPGTTANPHDKEILNKADKSFGAVSKLTPKPLKIQKAIIGGWWGWAKGAMESIDENLGGDPPRQDYDQVTLPVWHNWPAVQPDASVSITRAAAMNAASNALADANAYGAAAVVALDRYGGASGAQNLMWAAQQANAQIFYQEKMGDALLLYADALEAFVQVLVDEGETEIIVTASDVISYQQRLATTGFTAQEINDAHLIGFTDADIEKFRQGIIAANPNDIAGNLLTIYANEAAVARLLGRSLRAPSVFAPGLSIGGSAGLKPTTAISNTLAQVNNVVETIQVGNPLTQTETIELRIRRVDMPADWMVTVSPAQLSLAPGEQTTVTVTIAPGSPAAQNTVPRAAVEGYATRPFPGPDVLLGGVVIDVVVPMYVEFAPYKTYLPLIRR